MQSHLIILKVCLDPGLKDIFNLYTLRYGPFRCHGLLVELAQHEGDMRHIENYTDDVMWDWLVGPTPQGKLFLLNPPLSLPSRVKKTQYILHKRGWDVAWYPNSAVGQWQKLSLRCRQSDAASVTSHKEPYHSPAVPPPRTGLLCDTQNSAKIVQSKQNCEVLWHEGLVQVTLVK